MQCPESANEQPTVLKTTTDSSSVPEGVLTHERRRSLGIYYTPESAARLLATWAIRDPSDTLLEPSFGGCAILQAALWRLHQLGCNQPATQLLGFDVDPAAFTHLKQLLKDASHLGQFSQLDFLHSNHDKYRHVSTVIANPPFVSYHRMDARQRETILRWRSEHSPSFPKTASLWAYFLVHALSFLRRHGRLAFVLPNAIATSDYAKPLIDLVTRRFARVFLIHVNEQLFIQDGAEERTAILLAEDYQPVEGPPRAASEYKAVSLDELQQIVSSLSGQNMDHAQSRSDPAAAIQLLDELRLREALCAFGDVVRVQIGEVVGDTAFFVKTADEWQQLDIKSDYLKPLVTRTRQVSGIKLSESDIAARDSRVPLLLQPPRRQIPKSILRYLETYKPAKRNSNVTFAKRDPWYAVSYDTTAKAFIGSMSHEAPRIVLNLGAASCGNGLYKLSPVKGVRWRGALAAAALSTATQLSAEIKTRTRGGGAMKLEPSDVRALVVPKHYRNLNANEARSLVDKVDALSRAGRKEDAIRLVDETLLLAPGVVTVAQLEALSLQLTELRDSRLRRDAASVA